MCNSANNPKETLKGTLQDGEPAHKRGTTTQEWEYTNKVPNSRRRQEHPMRMGAVETNRATHTAPNSPECNQINA